MKKNLTFLWQILYFPRHVKKMAKGRVKSTMGSESADKNAIEYVFSK